MPLTYRIKLLFKNNFVAGSQAGKSNKRLTKQKNVSQQLYNKWSTLHPD